MAVLGSQHLAKLWSVISFPTHYHGMVDINGGFLISYDKDIFTVGLKLSPQPLKEKSAGQH